MQPLTFIECGFTDEYPWNDIAMSIQKSTDLIFLAYGFSRVSILSPSLDFLTTFTHDELAFPDCIAVQEHSIYVTDKDSCELVHFIEDTGFCECVNIGYLGAPSSLYAPVYKFCVSVQGEIYVADTWHNCVEVLDCNGMDCVRTITHTSLIKPHYIQVTEYEIYVILLGCRDMLVFSLEGVLNLTFPINQCYNKVERIIFFYFCIDPNNGNILLLEQDTKGIQTFSKQGKHLNTLTMISDDIVLSPVALAVSNNSDLLVNYLESKLVVFS